MTLSSARSLGGMILLVAVFANAQDSLSPPAAPTVEARPLTVLAGELPQIVKAESSPYLVTGDIVVPPGMTVTIEPGVSLLFKNFTCLQVHGTLVAAGTKESPIAFTSEHDKKHGSASTQEPAPYDWNGITITQNAVGTKFEFCRVGFSLYGINSLTEYFTAQDCLFRKNGKADVTIKGVKQELAQGVPYTYQPLGEAPVLPGTQGPSAGRIALRTSSIAVLIVGVAIGIWQTVEYSDASTTFDNVNDDTNLANLRNPTIVEDWESASDARDKSKGYMIAGYGGAVLGALGFGLSFAF